MRKLISIIFFGLTIIAFLIGLSNLFVLRFKRGDVYPAYSSLRSDPLGTKILYESLNAFSGKESVRHYRPISRLKLSPEDAFLYLGASALKFESRKREYFDEFEQLADDGGMVIISFSSPHTRRASKKDEEEDEGGKDDKEEQLSDNETPEDDKEIEESDEESEEDEEYVSMEEYWGVNLTHEENNTEHEAVYAGSVDMPKQSRITERQFWPDTFQWKSQHHFELTGDQWRILYSRDDYPVIVEKDTGKGRIMLLADSFYFSNESLWRERNTGFIFTLLHQYRTYIFDEAHFGVIHSQGIIDLIKRYRLIPFLFSLGVVAGLFVWRNSSSFIPIRSHKVQENLPNVISNKGYFEGLTSLLRRNISPKQVLKTCFEEYRKSGLFSYKGKKLLDENKESEIEEIIKINKEKSVDSVEGYKSISKILAEGSKYEKKS